MTGRPTIRGIAVGDELPPIAYPLTVYRLVMAAGANRDFGSIHTQRTGDSEMYAYTVFLLGMWKRAIRDWIGDEGEIPTLRDFRMGPFNTVGTTAAVSGAVVFTDPATGRATVRIQTEDSGRATVGPGEIDERLRPGEPPEVAQL